MTRLSRTITLPAVLLLLAAVATTQTPTPSGNAAPGDANYGKDLFIRYSCYACHGFSGQNGNGARLVPMKFPQAGFIAYVRNPPRANQMPSFSANVLADKDLADIYAYIKTLPDSAPPASSVPILSQILNQNQ
jgi:mono/diheme cytochrome c family protein